MIDAALLLLRSVSGGLLAGHGAQKLFGAFQGPGPEATAGMMGKLGLQPARFWARFGSATELAGGTMTAVGLLSPLGPIAALGPMAIATTMAHWGRPIWVTHGGAELPVTDAAIFTSLALVGPGRWSADRLLGVRVPRWVSVAAVAGVAGGTVAAHAMRQREQPQPAKPVVPAEDGEIELRATREREKAHTAPGTT